MKILAFLGMLIVGFSAIYFSYPLYQISGSFDWVEKVLGPGQTINFWRFLGVAIIISAFIYVVYL